MWFLILLIFGLSIGVDSIIKTGPSNTIAHVGDTVPFPCVTEVKTCTDIDWTKQEGVQPSVVIFKSSAGMLNNERYPVERYNVSSVDGCNLTIRELKLTDSGLFSCSEAKGEHEESRYFVLVVVESDKQCWTDAADGIAKGNAYNSSCSAKFNAALIKPSKIELKIWSGANQLSSVQSTDANAVELTYTGKAALPAIEFECNVSLSVEQSLPAWHDKSAPSFRTCTSPSINVSHPVTEITCKSGDKKVEKVQKSETVECIAYGYPPPTCECKSNKTGDTWSCSKFAIPETALNGDTYTCTATNTVSGKQSTVNVFLTVTEGSQAPVGVIAGIVVVVVVIVLLIVVAGVCCWYFLIRKKKLGNREKGDLSSEHPLKPAELAPPQKPPRASNSNQEN